MKGGKPMDEFAGFKLPARQIHPQTGGGVLLVEADNLAAVQKHTYPWTKGLESLRRSPLVSAMRSLSSLSKEDQLTTTPRWRMQSTNRISFRIQ
ncbi:DUF3303 domain-containing protein [Synechococcus sp. AH-229-G18]|nr:DUF3303 domain-containing protein [Synechococcus sp. AH-229-G18]